MKKYCVLIVLFVSTHTLIYSQNSIAVDTLIIKFFKDNKILDKPIYEVTKKNGKIYQTSNFTFKKEEVKINDSIRLVLNVFSANQSHSKDYLLVALMRDGRLLEDYFFLGNNSIEKDLLLLSSKIQTSLKQINDISKKKILKMFSQL